MLEYYRFKVVHDLFMKGQAEEARMQLAALQSRYVALCEDNATLKAQAQEYENILYLARNLVFDGSCYWLTTGSIKQGPFCPTCYNRDGLLVRLTETGLRRCQTCGEHLEKPRASARSSGEYGFARVLQQSAAVGGLKTAGDLLQNRMADAPATEQARKAKILPFAR